MGLAGILNKIATGVIEKADDLEPFKDFDELAEADKLLESTEVVPVPTPNDKYRASSLGRMCPREEVLCFINKIERTKKVSSSLRRTFDIGHSFHNLVQNEWFGKWGWLVGDWECAGKKCPMVWKNQTRPKKCPECGSEKFNYSELYFEDEEHGITGHIDCIMERNGHRKLVELKTCNSKVYSFLTTVRRDALDGHKDQMNIYFYLSKIKFGSVVYLDKDESNWKRFPQNADSARINYVLKKVKDAREGMRTGKVPPREMCKKKDCTRAKSCSVRKLCFEDSGG